MKLAVRLLLLAIVVCLSAGSWAEEKPDLEVKAVRTDSPPVIDGELDDDAWRDAPVLTDFTDTRLENLAKQQTFVRVLYDDEYIYIAAEMMQDPETILATIFKYDRFQLRFEDYIQVGLDTFFSRKEAYLFLVSPIGTRWDAREGVFGRNDSWDADWDAKTSIKEDRWIAEMRIPIGAMHHSQQVGETWGLNFRRQSREINIPSHWNYDPAAGVNRRASGPKFIADFGLLTDLDLSNSVVQSDPEFEVYASTTMTRSRGDTDVKFSTGLDLSLRLTSNLISSFALNPDFGQVEADSDTIELRDTERFLPERRPFFNEGAELFRTPINVYNSRRIIDIELAAKVSGNGERWTMASLVLQGESTRSGEASFLVGRYTYSATDELQVGGIWVSAFRGNGFNVVAGPDVRWALSPSIVFTAEFLQEFDENDGIDDGAGGTVVKHKNEHGFEMELEGGSQPFFWQVDFKKISPDFNPDLAFISRQDIIGPGIRLNFNENVAEGPIEGYGATVSADYYQDHQGDTTRRDYFAMANIDLRNNFDFRLFHSENFRRPFQNRNTGLRVDYNRQNRLRSIGTTISTGEFEDVPFVQFDLQKPFGIGERFTGEFTGSIRREDPHMEDPDSIWLVRMVTEYTFRWEGRVKFTLEQSSEDRYNRTLLFAYEDIGNWDFFFVLNDIQSGDIVTRGFFTKFVYRF